MALQPSSPDWIEQTLESTRRNVRQLEIDACRIRTDLARIEVANAAVKVNGEIGTPLCDAESDASTQSEAGISALATPPGSPDVEPPGPNRVTDVAFDWQPAAEMVPSGMEILVGAPRPNEVFSPPADPQPNCADADIAEMSSLSGLIDRSRRVYRRATSPFVASLIVHGAILLVAVSITVATIERDDPQFVATILNLGDQPAKELENFDPHSLADLGETGVQSAVADAAKFDAVASPERETIPIDFKSLDGPASMGRVGLSDSIPTDLGTLMSGAGGLNTDGQGAAAGLGNGNQRGGAGASARPKDTQAAADWIPRSSSAPKQEATGLCLSSITPAA